MSDAEETPSQKQVSAVPVVYVLDIPNGFFADLSDGWEHFRFHASEKVADEWRESLMRAVWQILENPLGYGLALEYTHFKNGVRRMLHQRTKSSATYRVLFYLKEPITQEDGTKVTPVFVFAAIHGSAKPLSMRKARALERRN